MVRHFIALQQPAAGAGSRQIALAGRSSASAAHKFLCSLCALGPFATALTAPAAPLLGPPLLGWRQWCIDIHANKSLLGYLADENQKCRCLLTYLKHLDI